MAQETINIGTAANDGTGDTLREAGDKINANFTEVYASLGTTGAVVVSETTTAANLDPANASKYQRWTNAAAKTLTVQAEATEALPDNAEWHVRNVGAADLTLVADAGVTINAPNGGTLVVPSGGTITLKRVDEDEFDLLGQTVAA